MQKNKKLTIILLALAISLVTYFLLQKKESEKKSIPIAPKFDSSSIGGIEAGQIPNNGTGNASFPLARGSRGKKVQMLQVLVGVTPDGSWGNNTENAVNTKLHDNNITKPEFVTYVTAQNNTAGFPLVKNSRSNYTKALQIIYGLSIDGIYGQNTIAKTGLPFVTVSEYNRIIDNFLKNA